jgi:hypothetical protein
MGILGNNPQYKNAAALARLPANMHPMRNHEAFQRMTPPQRVSLSYISAHPQLNALAHGAPVSSTTPDLHSEALGGASLSRSPTSRQNLVGFIGTAIPAGSTVGVAAVPYGRSFRATKCVISPITLAAAGYPSSIGQWQVGERSQYSATTYEPMTTYAGGVEAGRLRFHKAVAATPIVAQASATLTCTFYAGLVGTTEGRKSNNRPPREFRKEDILPITPQLIAPGASVVIPVTPVRRFWPTRVWLDDNSIGLVGYGYIGGSGGGPPVGAASLLFSNIFCGPDPQFMSANLGTGLPYIPGNMFSSLVDLPIDFDELEINEPMQFAVFNGGTASAWFGGKILGDVDRRDGVQNDDQNYDSND